MGTVHNTVVKSGQVWFNPENGYFWIVTQTREQIAVVNSCNAVGQSILSGLQSSMMSPSYEYMSMNWMLHSPVAADSIYIGS